MKSNLTPKKLKNPIKQIFDPKPLDQFIQKHIDKLPKMPEAVKKKLLQDAKFFSEYGIKTDDPTKFIDLLKQHEKEKKALESIKVEEKKAYPNYDSYLYVQPPRNIRKWIQAVQDLHFFINRGQNSETAMQEVSKGWDHMEKLDFQNWLRFYQGGNQDKYKTAQVNYWEDANRAGYFVPIFPESPKAPLPTRDVEQARDAGISLHEKKEVIEKQRNKIIGRLDSTEKLLRSQEGQLFAGDEFEALLEIIYQLKKKIHLVNKISTSTKLYEDMIVREANVLSRRGFVKAAGVLHSVAQALPNPMEASNPLDNVGNVGNLPGAGPGMTPTGNAPIDTFPPTDPSAAGPISTPPGIASGQKGMPNDAPLNSSKAEPISEGMKEFLDGLDTNNDTFDEEDAEDTLEVFDDMISTAQAIKDPQAIEMNEKQVDPNTQPGKDFESMIDSAFSGLTVEDVVLKLEDVANIFKVREIPHQLYLVDLMLNQLDLAALFPSLAEAINKSLESNQYISTRVDDILSRLRGTLDAKELDLGGEEREQSPQTQQIKEQLGQENKQEQVRKKQRKDLENQDLTNANKITPDIDVAKEMAEPAPAQKAAPPLPTAPR